MIGSLFLFSRSPLSGPSTFQLCEGTFTVGRSSGCDLVIQHESVSRRHAKLHVVEGCVSVADLNSRNGTFINDERIKSSSHLVVGQKVTFGGIPFVLVCQDAERAVIDSAIETTVQKEPGRTLIPENVLAKLSPAECSVLIHLVEGLSEKDTAERLALSPHTVHNHVREIYSILKVHSRGELLELLLKR